MRVLVSSMGAIGHVNPMVPLARALQARGHDVLWATAAESCARLEQAGLATSPVGRSQADFMAEFWRRHPEVRELPHHERPDVMFPKVFGEVSAPVTLAELLPLARSWQPSLVVHDAAELAGPIAAAAIGVPHVTHAFGALLPEARVRAAGDEVAALWRAQGLEPRPYGGSYDHLYLDIYPPSLRMPGGDHVGARQQLRPVSFAGGDEQGSAADIIARVGRPLVYLTFGTVFNHNDAFSAAVAGIRDLGVGLVVTVGPSMDPAALGPQPGNVVVERYIPQTQLLPACAVVASHAGSGTALAALARAIPQLCLPQAADQFLNAAAIARGAAGIMLAPADVSAAAVSEAVRRLLDDASFRDRAGLIGAEIAAMPAPDEVAAVLEALT